MTNEQIIESLKNGEKTVSQIEDELTEEARRQELADMKKEIEMVRRYCNVIRSQANGYFDTHHRRHIILVCILGFTLLLQVANLIFAFI